MHACMILHNNIMKCMLIPKIHFVMQWILCNMHIMQCHEYQKFHAVCACCVDAWYTWLCMTISCAWCVCFLSYIMPVMGFAWQAWHAWMHDVYFRHAVHGCMISMTFQNMMKCMTHLLQIIDNSCHSWYLMCMKLDVMSNDMHD